MRNCMIRIPECRINATASTGDRRRDEMRYRLDLCSMGRISSPHCLLSLLILTLPVVTAVITTEQAMLYLQKYGHMKVGTSQLKYNENPQTDSKSFIQSFQRFAGLPQTGVLDPETLGKMSLSRCGVSDFVDQPQQSGNRRQKRYVLGGSSWPTNMLTYSFRNYTRKLNQQLVRSIVRRAIQLWTNVSGVQFSEVPLSLPANIRMQYSVLNHGDGFPFDGTGGVLAHTFYPNTGYWSGDVHFDDDENWTDGVNQGTNLFQVTTHELGHALGLAHSSDPNSVMQPFYSGYNPNFKLGQDDIKGINYIYGVFNQPSPTLAASSTMTPTVSSNNRGSQSALCNNATIDAIVTVNKAIYVFRGNTYLIMDCCNPLPSIRNGFPRLLSADWPGLNINSVDAAVFMNPTSNSAGYLYIFSGQMYWRFSSLPSTAVDPGYPRNISVGFPGVPDNVDTAFTWGVNNRTYFVKGSLYYRYASNLGVERRFPKPLSLWLSLPTNQRVNAAFRSADMKTYFFVGTSFYQFDDVTFKVGDALSTARYWFNCS